MLNAGLLKNFTILELVIETGTKRFLLEKKKMIIGSTKKTLQRNIFHKVGHLRVDRNNGHAGKVIPVIA